MGLTAPVREREIEDAMDSSPPRQRVLVVEDDARIRAELRLALDDSGYQAVEASSVGEARGLLAEGCALVLLDLGLPDEDGLDLCREMRAAGDDTPVVMLTARDANEQRIAGLDAGADDYVVKPVDSEVLLARVRSVLRRSTGAVAAGPARCGTLWADGTTRKAGDDRGPFDLTPLEFDLLLFLLRHPDRAWSRDQLLERVWGLHGGAGGTRTVDIHVRRLRAKLEPDPAEPRYLTTVWGVGYRLVDPEAEA